MFCIVDITTMYQIQGYPSTLRKEMRMAYILAVLLLVRTYGPLSWMQGQVSLPKFMNLHPAFSIR